MKPRDFLAERDYPLTLALTYTFAPVFFERLALPSLWSGGADDVLVLADAGEVDRAFQRAHGAIHHLGRRYLLAPVRREGAFHPKLVLRMGRDSGAVWLSTGNLTHGGWGLNKEVGAAWKFGPEHEDQGEWVRPLLEQASSWASSPLADRLLDRMSDLPWLPSGRVTDGRLLFSGTEPLGAQLAGRWAGRRFDRLRFLTGSTDKEGRVLRWLNTTFGVSEAVGALTPTRCAWTVPPLKSLPLDLRLSVHHAPILHAKAYHLSGSDGDVLLVGSANCSYSAWLRPPAEGGNVEAFLVYEDPSPADLEFITSVIGEDARPAASVLADVLPPEEEEPAPTPTDLRLNAFHIEEDGAVALHVEGVPSDRSLVLVLEKEEIPLRKESSHWIGRAPDTLAAGQTAFGYVEARMEGQPPLRSGRRWADDLRLLHQAGGVRRLGRKLDELRRSGTRREDDRLLQELSQLAHDLIHDVRALRDPFSTQPKGNGDESVPVVAVDPEALINSLKEVVVPTAHPITEETIGTSLGGIFRALFGEAEAESEGHELGTADIEVKKEGEEDPGATDPEEDGLPEPVADKTRERFAAHMDRFVAEIQTPAFRNDCTVTQLVQAIGYPFAATTLGIRRNWTDKQSAREWLAATASTLLRKGSEGEEPLLDLVRERYSRNDSSEVFNRIVGEGTLWVVMAVGLADMTWPGPAGALQRMLFLRDLWNEDFLRANADPQRLDGLVRRHRAEKALALVRDVAAPMAGIAGSLERKLAHLCEHGSLLALQAETRQPVKAGELLWGPTNDWALPLEPEEKGVVYVFWPQRSREARIRVANHFVSVPQVAEMDAEVGADLDRLRDLWARLAKEDSRSSREPELIEPS